MVNLYFQKALVEFIVQNRLSNDLNLIKTAEIKSKIINLPPKYFEREYPRVDPENGYGYLIRKQQGQRYNFKTKQEEYDANTRVTCVVLERETVNSLGSPDLYYYYVINRNKLLSSWAPSLELKKYGRANGFYLPFYILKHVDESKTRNQSELILMLEIDGELKTYYCSFIDLFKYFHDNRMPILMSAYGEQITGIPISIMKEYKYEK